MEYIHHAKHCDLSTILNIFTKKPKTIYKTVVNSVTVNSKRTKLFKKIKYHTFLKMLMCGTYCYHCFSLFVQTLSNNQSNKSKQLK